MIIGAIIAIDIFAVHYVFRAVPEYTRMCNIILNYYNKVRAAIFLQEYINFYFICLVPTITNNKYEFPA